MSEKKGIVFVLNFLLIFVVVSLYQFPQDQVKVEGEKNRKIEKFLSGYFSDDLQIKDIFVKVDKDIVAISGTPDFRDKGKATAQIIFALSGAGVAAPKTKNISFTIHINGLPIGFIEVATGQALLASEEKISEKDFISSFRATMLPIPFDFPGDLLNPVIRSSDEWENSSVVECDAGEMENILSVDAGEFLPELLQSAYILKNSADGTESSVAAVIDFGNDSDAKDFLKMNVDQSGDSRLIRVGTVVYIIRGPAEVVEKGLNALKPKVEKIAEKKKVVENLSSDKKENKTEVSGNKYIIIGAGFFLLIIILVTVFILSGKSGSRE